MTGIQEIVEMLKAGSDLNEQDRALLLTVIGHYEEMIELRNLTS